jgi:predicted GNAT family acetyltransferase
MGEEGVRVGVTSNDVTAHRAGDEDLDETLEETFPASDAPANTVETGIRVAAAPDAGDVIDNREKARFEVTVDGQTAVLYYERTLHSLTLVHTEVPPAIRGRHVADVLAGAAIDRAHADGLQIVAVCPFVKAYLRKHPGSEGRQV